MPEQREVVYEESIATDRLPDWASRGVVMIEWLRQQGHWDEIAARLNIQREGGYAGIDGLRQGQT